MFESYSNEHGVISEPVKTMYRLFLNGAFVSERKMYFDSPDRDDFVEDLKIQSNDGTCTADFSIRRYIGIISYSLSRHSPSYDPLCDLHGIGGLFYK